jgi:putative ABC transport system permease protein
VLKQNLRYAIRFLRKSPGFTFVVVLTLALGIGANTAIFSVVYSALLRPLPYQHPNELLFLGESRDQHPNIEMAQSSYPDFLDWKRTARSFASIAGYGSDGFIMEAGGEPKLTLATRVTPNFFATLGVKPALGRDFVDGEDQPDGPHVAILSDTVWRNEFGANRNALGSSIRLDGKQVTVVGVLPGSFQFAPVGSAPIWVPVHAPGDLGARRSLRWFSVFGRLKPGVSAQQARAEMVGIMAQLAQAYPKEDDSTVFVMSEFRQRISGKIRPLLLVLLGAVGFVLLISCANVANLLLTRSISRRKEFAVRAALGASRRNLIAQLLGESLLLSVFGAAAGFVGAELGVRAMVAAIPESQLQAMPYLRSAGVNVPVLAFLCGITVITGILFGLAPALAFSQSSTNDVLKDETRGGTSSSHARFRNALVVVEIAVCLVLLVGGSLMLQSLHALVGQDRGFDPRNVLTFDINLPDTSYPNDKDNPNRNAASDNFAREFMDRMRNSPGVISVASTTVVPVSGGGGTIRFLIEGRPKALGREDECHINEVSGAYFATMKIPLVQGRFFAPDDTKPNAPNVVMVSRAFVNAYFPNENPIGKRIRYTFNAQQPFRQIIGVAGDVTLVDLDAPPPPIIYEPNERNGDTYLSYVVRTASDPAAFVGLAGTTLHRMDPQLPLIQPRTLEQVAEQAPSVFLRSYPSLLIGSFAGLALILAMIGLYGVISYSVQQRTREIGIRVAMGAQRPDVLSLVLREGIVTASLGVVVGVVSGLFLTRLLSSLLFGVKPGDWLTFTVASVCLLLVALAACAIPARRATLVDPIIALRYE